MSAHWPVGNGDTIDRAHAAAPLRRVSLGMLFAATARRHPERIAFVDPADKPAWSGRPAITWTYGASAEIVDRLARGIRGWRLPPASRIGLCLPGSTESALAFLAVEAAGHLPCLLPVCWDEAKLLSAAQNAGLCAILSQSRLGSLALAEQLCTVAAGYFGLRYLAAFGPDVPDGVINLDRMVLEGRDAPASSVPASPGSVGVVCFSGGDPDRPVRRGGDGLVAAAAAHLVAARTAPDDRILSLIGPHDLRGLVTGLAAALVSGARLETLPLFDGAGFAAALSQPVPTHLVAPAFLEGNLAGRSLPESLRSVVFVHRAPTRFAARHGRDRDGLRVPAIVDAVAFDDLAIVSGRRSSAGDVALVLGRPERLALPSGLLAMRREPDGRLAFAGQACAAMPLQRGDSVPASPNEWQASPYEATRYAELATEIRVSEGAGGTPAP